MRKEFESLSSPLNMELVRKTACEMFLADGQQIPTLIVQTESNIEIFYVPNLSDTYQGQAMQMAEYGLSFAITHPKDQVLQVYFVSEAWMRFQTDAQDQSPASKEILSIVRMKAEGQSLVQDLSAYEIHRKSDHSVEKLTEYRPLHEEMPYDSSILKHFMAGYLFHKKD
jgi:hypothetical protein